VASAEHRVRSPRPHRSVLRARNPSRLFDFLQPSRLGRADAGLEDRLGLEVEARIEGLVERLAGFQVVDEFLGESRAALRQRIAFDHAWFLTLALDQSDLLATRGDDRALVAVENRAG